MTQFPSIKAKKLLTILMRKPLEYKIIHQVGSHRKLISPNGYPNIIFSYHDKITVSPNAIKDMLINEIGLTEKEALGLI
jgi:predicted RNA binding protein YcfA (HicA-like mRNA interferase family)